MKDYILTELSENYAKEICIWRYEGAYSIYNFSDWDIVVKNGWDLSLDKIRRLEFVAILLDKEFVAYGRMSFNEDKAYIGIGIKPSLCGKGHGKNIMKLLIEECERRFPDKTVALEVRSFNKRAINCYEKVGFEIKRKYIRETFDKSEAEFYYMEYNG